MKKLTTEPIVRTCFCELACPYGWKKMNAICRGITAVPCNVDFNKLARSARRFVKMEQKQNDAKRKLDQENNLREVEGYPVLNKEKR